MNLYEPLTGALLLAGYAAISIALAVVFARARDRSKEEFLVARRELGRWPAAFSIAATWIWAPALFIAAQKAYQQGWVGLFWFTVPNVLCLVVFGYFAARIRERLPLGYTLSAFMRSRYSRRVQGLYLVELIGLAACSFAVQLLAGGAVIATLTGIPLIWVTIALAATAVSYSLFSGIRASVVTDYAQMIWILLVAATVVPMVVSAAGGLDTVRAGLSGVSGKFTSLWSGEGGSVFWTFGLSVTIGLMSGPFGDQSFWQRAFATKKSEVKSAFIWGALIFAVVPLSLSVLGFVAAGIGHKAASAQLVNLEMVIKFAPTWMLVPFVYMLLSGLVSTLDSNLCAVSGMVSHDLVRDDAEVTDASAIKRARVGMLLLAVVGLAIANAPGIKILYLFLFYGTLRASTLLPTVMTLIAKEDAISERGVFWGIVVSITVGLPVFGYGNFYKDTTWMIVGSLVTVLASGAIAWVWSARRQATAAQMISETA